MLLGTFQMMGIFSKKLRGTIAYFLGFLLIVLNYKVFGVVIQLYSIYEFFKSIAFKLLSYLTYIPIIGPYIQRFLESNSQSYVKKNDKTNEV